MLYKHVKFLVQHSVFAICRKLMLYKHMKFQVISDDYKISSSNLFHSESNNAILLTNEKSAREEKAQLLPFTANLYLSSNKL